jgi:hypothetical protein
MVCLAGAIGLLRWPPRSTRTFAQRRSGATRQSGARLEALRCGAMPGCVAKSLQLKRLARQAGR